MFLFATISTFFEQRIEYRTLAEVTTKHQHPVITDQQETKQHHTTAETTRSTNLYMNKTKTSTSELITTQTIDNQLPRLHNRAALIPHLQHCTRFKIEPLNNIWHSIRH